MEITYNNCFNTTSTEYCTQNTIDKQSIKERNDLIKEMLTTSEYQIDHKNFDETKNLLEQNVVIIIGETHSEKLCNKFVEKMSNIIKYYENIELNLITEGLPRDIPSEDLFREIISNKNFSEMLDDKTIEKLQSNTKNIAICGLEDNTKSQIIENLFEELVNITTENTFQPKIGKYKELPKETVIEMCQKTIECIEEIASWANEWKTDNKIAIENCYHLKNIAQKAPSDVSFESEGVIKTLFAPTYHNMNEIQGGVSFRKYENLDWVKTIENQYNKKGKTTNAQLTIVTLGEGHLQECPLGLHNLLAEKNIPFITVKRQSESQQGLINK